MAAPQREGSTSALIAAMLGGRRLLRDSPRSTAELRTLARAGLPNGVIGELSTQLGTSETELRRIVRLAPRTAARRKDANLKPDESDRVMRVARVFARAQRVLGDRDRAAAWLRRANRALGDALPLDLLDTDIGAADVEDVLVRIEHGVLG